MSTWWTETEEKIIKWGTRSEWHKPTAFEVCQGVGLDSCCKNHHILTMESFVKVIAEDVLPWVILALFAFIFAQVAIMMRRPDGNELAAAKAKDVKVAAASRG